MPLIVLVLTWAGYSLLERTANAIAERARAWTVALVAESDRARTMDATINSIESRGRIRKERSQRMKLVIWWVSFLLEG